MSEEKRKKKPASEMTTKELARKLFPREVRRDVERELREKPKKSEKKPAIKDKDRG